ncbi:hypothetical protein [uncultured Bdellovibrio sp.]|uniref:hypothetical protein n=1 Tax=Bdellovibrio sp. HCB-162 TaxID=3394234 RepID=UPI0025D5C36D|nr:hypothetical protein [uncultured Bdellovibrio sp.]
MNLKLNALALIALLGLGTVACQGGGAGTNEYTEDSADLADHIHNDASVDEEIQSLGCMKASGSQKTQVNLGLSKKDRFLQKCAAETNNSFWCDQVVRPNPRSVSTFRCTYGSSQAHNLVHPDENTWKYPIEAVKILHDLTAKGIKVSQIYNWWRPEPYNKNVGGAAGRHPYGTSIDVRFASNSEADRAFRELCKMRSQKRIRAIGHYGSASLHIGVGDKVANTWGKSCN